MSDTTSPLHPPSGATRRRAACRVLHVDADASHVASMCKIFAADDVELITAASGEAGIELARVLRPDLILLGLELPRMSGVETVAMLRESEATSHIPIVALSSADRQNVPGLSMYCRKPVPVSELVSMVRVLLARSRSKRSPWRGTGTRPNV